MQLYQLAKAMYNLAKYNYHAVYGNIEIANEIL